MDGPGFLHASSGPLRHALAFAGDIYRRCVRNKEPAWKVAKSLQLDDEQVQAAASLLRKCNRVPSDERLALVVMKDRGLDDDDVAEMFSRSRRWAEVVRQQADAIKAEEQIDDTFYPWVFDDDPPPEEILEMAKQFRVHGGRGRSPRVAGVRQVWWMGNKFDAT